MDDDEDVEEPPAKKLRERKSPAPDDPDTQTTKKPELTSSEALLDKLEAYIRDAIDMKVNIERKVLDALLGAINIQVQREPLSVRKLILDKQLVLPNTISFPPSQVFFLFELYCCKISNAEGLFAVTALRWWPSSTFVVAKHYATAFRAHLFGGGDEVRAVGRSTR
ncbi:unnamed protein product [Gongylonema pulchrum]|uniref:Uncharacterized protein n=1 Tax=Gongylonema pulchrum TaxID=637853 RepID=A0A3P7QMU6_9BILA|nr:unnamed protein product [Gongylonema pulchrum]